MKSALILFISLNLSSLSIYSQKLDKSKHNLKKDSHSRSYHSKENSYSNDDSELSFQEQLIYELLVKPILYLGKAMVYGLLIEGVVTKESKHPYMDLTPYPYLKNLRGDYAYEANEKSKTRIDLSNQFLTGTSNIYGNNLNVKFRFLQRASIEYNQLYLLENTKPISTFFMHDITANYYRIRTKSLSLNYGLGVSYVHSNINKAYFTYNTGIHYHFKSPISISLEHRGTPFVDYGIKQTNANINIHKQNFSFKVGMGFYNIGDVNYSLFAVGGKIYI